MSFGSRAPIPVTGAEVMVDIPGPLVLDWQMLFDVVAQYPVVKPGNPPHFGLPHLPRVPASRNRRRRVAYADAHQHRDVEVAVGPLTVQNSVSGWQHPCTAHLAKCAGRCAVLPTGAWMCLLLTESPRTDHPSVRYAGHRYYPRLLKAG